MVASPLKQYLFLSVFIVLALQLGACASRSVLTDAEAISKYEEVAQLEQMIATSDMDKISVLSPVQFEKALSALEEAKRLAKQDDSKAVEVAARGEDYFTKAHRNAQEASEVFSEVMAARQKAMKMGAALEMPEELKTAEEDFRELTKDYEEGRIAQAKVRRPELIRQYARLEMKAIKGATLEQAQQYLNRAKELAANKHAKQTYALAEKELNVAMNMLESDRTKIDAAETHAAKAIALARQSIAISDLVKEFNANDFTLEEIVLWYQGQLSRGLQPFMSSLPFDQPNQQLISYVNKEIGGMVDRNLQLEQENNQLTASMKQGQQKYTQEMAGVKEKQRKTEDMRSSKRKKMDFVQTLFNEKEAKVYQQDNDILIRAPGFHFASGQTEIDSRNFPLLQKIVKAVDQYPGSRVRIIGHTDSTGNDEMNLALSKERAMKVAKFLNEVAGIPIERIDYEGVGESKPIATNATGEGRAENRRIEIYIENPAS